LYICLTMSDLSPPNWVALSDKRQILALSKYINKIVQFMKNKILLTLFFITMFIKEFIRYPQTRERDGSDILVAKRRDTAHSPTEFSTDCFVPRNDLNEGTPKQKTLTFKLNLFQFPARVIYMILLVTVNQQPLIVNQLISVILWFEWSFNGNTNIIGLIHT